MDELYSWVRNITFYLIFITVLANILPNKKYEKYIKLFAGMVLIFLVIKPLTGSLRLEDRIAYYFESITFQNDADDLRDELIGMEDKRLNAMISQYEEAVELDLENMIKDSGFYPVEIKAMIEDNQDSERYGTVSSVNIVASSQADGEALAGDENAAPAESGVEIEPVEPIEPVVIGEDGDGEQTEIKSGQERQEDNDAISSLRKKISDYYELDTEKVVIRLTP